MSWPWLLIATGLHVSVGILGLANADMEAQSKLRYLKRFLFATLISACVFMYIGLIGGVVYGVDIESNAFVAFSNLLLWNSGVFLIFFALAQLVSKVFSWLPEYRAIFEQIAKSYRKDLYGG